MPKPSGFFIGFAILLAFSASVFAGSYSSAWQAYLADHSQDRTVGAVITMADQVDLRSLQDQLYAQHADRQAWHEAVVRALQEKATSTQGDILATLADMEARGEVDSYKALWVANIIIINATSSAVDQLAQRRDVLQVSPDYEVDGSGFVSDENGGSSITNVMPGLKAIFADSCWALGITGEGRLISSLDTGVDGNHEAFSGRWRGTADGRYADHPEWAWFDPVTFTSFPFDSGTHGTHGMGIMTGVAGTDTIGVAFGAQWISAAVIDRVSIQRTIEDAISAFQWVTDPDSDPSTVWDVPDVCSNAWGLATGHGVPPCDDAFWAALDGVQAAGVVAIFGAGGDGPVSRSIRRPADRATTDVNAFAVGAVDSNDPNMPVASFSSRGPSNCTPEGSDTFKPEVGAPGVNVRSSVPGGYDTWSGTAAATSHVAGVVALIRQANPNLSSEEVCRIILQTSVDRGAPGDDNNYGMGTINAYAAVLEALRIDYEEGDVNGNNIFNGIDVTYAVNYLKGFGDPPPLNVNCPGHGILYAAADANGNCAFNGIDVTFMVNYLKGIGPAPSSCPDCPPLGGR